MKYQIFENMLVHVTIYPEQPVTVRVKVQPDREFSLRYCGDKFICWLDNGKKLLWESDYFTDLAELENWVDTKKRIQLELTKSRKYYWAYVNGKRLVNVSLKAQKDQTAIPNVKRQLQKQYPNIEFRFEV